MFLLLFVQFGVGIFVKFDEIYHVFDVAVFNAVEDNYVEFKFRNNLEHSFTLEFFDAVGVVLVGEQLLLELLVELAVVNGRLLDNFIIERGLVDAEKRHVLVQQVVEVFLFFGVKQRAQVYEHLPDLLVLEVVEDGIVAVALRQCGKRAHVYVRIGAFGEVTEPQQYLTHDGLSQLLTTQVHLRAQLLRLEWVFVRHELRPWIYGLRVDQDFSLHVDQETHLIIIFIVAYFNGTDLQRNKRVIQDQCLVLAFERFAFLLILDGLADNVIFVHGFVFVHDLAVLNRFAGVFEERERETVLDYPGDVDGGDAALAAHVELLCHGVIVFSAFLHKYAERIVLSD